MTATTAPRHRRSHRPPTPAPAPPPPRRPVPDFRPICRGGGGRHRLRQATRYHPGTLLTGIAICATAALASGTLPGPALGPRHVQHLHGLPDCPAQPP